MKVCIQPHFVGREPVWEEHKEFYKNCVGPGWQKHLDDLTLKLEALGWNGMLDQVKEKFGTLRFYWVNNIQGIFGEIAEDLVENAEARSGFICEECGKYGKLRGQGWVVTLCTECWEKRLKEKNKLVVAALVEADGCTCKGDFTCEAHRA